MAKIKINLKLKEVIKIIQEEVKAGYFKALVFEIRKIISKTGTSPVEGLGRFQKYSDSYLTAIKRDGLNVGKKKSPVNMTLTGEMVYSLEAVDKKSGAVDIRFDDKKAVFHNDKGAGKAKTIRRLLPTQSGERFTTRIQREVVKAFKEIVKKSKL